MYFKQIHPHQQYITDRIKCTPHDYALSILCKTEKKVTEERNEP